MRLCIAAAALALSCACSTGATPAHVVAAERARADAIARRDTEAYSRLVSPDLLVIDQRGSLLNRDDRITSVGSGEASSARRVESDVAIRIYGDVAIVTGRSTWQNGGVQCYDFFTRIWAGRGGQLKMVGAHYTDITRQMTDDDPTSPGNVVVVPPEAIGTPPPGTDPEEDVASAIRAQHRAYWSKDPGRYRQYAGPDVIRIAENGMRTREELIRMMRGNARLPAPPSDQLDVRVRLHQNVAVTTWLDSGVGLLGNPTQLRFTVVFVPRAGGWQMVHIQSSGVRQ
jgi:Domain of unknown function (DUF4440)/SnoaL-like domain